VRDKPERGKIRKVYSYATILQRRKEKWFKRARCPICGAVGSGPYLKKIRGREYFYFKHSRKYSNRVWHYIGPRDQVEAAGGVEAYLERLRGTGSPPYPVNWERGAF